MEKHFREGKEYKVGALEHDGLYLERHGPGELDEEVLRRCEGHILATLGITVKLVEKSLEPTVSDLERLWGERCLHKIKGPEKQMIYLLAR
jgi:hypothetical protein